ncbi:Constitutive photomorphogenesis protein 10 [Camellia lanceoleosa]|uniref:Constitutive photomorphogenesis protein 10 n=1 Tax=Camellia lanceoleosa TaxID=1840588 RepID=A0ACC0FQ83_9ERIC|nr:Constitutive photomorphogenesis protein 10 [Camellia lanceoleosa]
MTSSTGTSAREGGGRGRSWPSTTSVSASAVICSAAGMLVLLSSGCAGDNPVVPGIARLYLADREKHDELAAEWTLRFAR